MGVVFFPSLPFVGVMLFPSFVLGNVSGEGGIFFVPLSIFCSSFSSSPFVSFSFSFVLSSIISSFFPHLILPFFVSSFLPHLFFPLPHKLFPSLFSSSPLFHLVFLSSFLPEVFFFFFEATACTVYFQDVIDDTTNCN